MRVEDGRDLTALKQLYSEVTTKIDNLPAEIYWEALDAITYKKEFFDRYIERKEGAVFVRFDKIEMKWALDKLVQLEQFANGNYSVIWKN
jgi:hypothetical protein